MEVHVHVSETNSSLFQPEVAALLEGIRNGAQLK
jgi:hypothetical protein